MIKKTLILLITLEYPLLCSAKTCNTGAIENKTTQTETPKKKQLPEESPLCLAVQDDNLALAQQLAKTATAKELGAALIAAANNDNQEIILMLLQAGANPKKQGRGALSEATRHEDLIIAKMLLIAGADPDELSGSPLQNAAYFGSSAMVKLLLAWKADPNSRSYFWKTPLHFAAENGHDEIVEILIEAGADVDVFEWGFLGRYRETPLHKAANEGHIACAQALLNAGADINLKDVGIFNETALSKALKNHRTSMAKFLKKRGATT